MVYWRFWLFSLLLVWLSVLDLMIQLEYILYQKHFNRDSHSGSDKTLSFCGFRKPHPHAKNSTIRLGFEVPTSPHDVVAYLAELRELQLVLDPEYL